MENIITQLIHTDKFTGGAEIRRLITAKAIKVNGQIADKDMSLNDGDIINVGKHKQFIFSSK